MFIAFTFPRLVDRPPHFAMAPPKTRNATSASSSPAGRRTSPRMSPGKEPSKAPPEAPAKASAKSPGKAKAAPKKSAAQAKKAALPPAKNTMSKAEYLRRVKEGFYSEEEDSSDDNNLATARSAFHATAQKVRIIASSFSLSFCSLSLSLCRPFSFCFPFVGKIARS